MKPMLASPVDMKLLRFPLFASVKLDGVRALITSQGVMSRSLKLIPNKHVQKLLRDAPHGYDGELIVGEPDHPTVYRTTVSGVMKEEGEPRFTFFVFDTYDNPTLPYYRRFHDPNKVVPKPPIVFLPQTLITCVDEMLDYEQKMLDEGYEGLILRDMDAPYKFGRSTAKEGYLLKLKRFEDAEATVVGFEELMHNGNEAKTNELGRTQRSSHKENKSGLGTLGALICQWGGMTFNIGTGFTAADRAEIWKNRDKYYGEVTKFKYFTVGMKDVPRHPVWLGWRDRRDM